MAAEIKRVLYFVYMTLHCFSQFLRLRAMLAIARISYGNSFCPSVRLSACPSV